MKVLVKAVDGQSLVAGDVISVKSDGHEWGGKEGLPLFWQLNIADAVAEDFASTIEPERVDSGEDYPHDGGRRYTVGRKRLKGLNAALLPAGAQADLTNTGMATITKAEFDAAVVDR